MALILTLQKKVALLICVLLVSALTVQAQRIKNPSFEGTVGDNVVPPMWLNCGQYSTPDTQPGAWYVTLPPAHGNTYLGMVCRQRENGSFESVTQELNYPFHKDSCYTFEISLAYDPDYDHPGLRQPAILSLWGGNGLCTTVENLWNSPTIDHKEWRTYVATFSPMETCSTITLQAYFAALPFYNGSVLIDHIRNIQAYPKPSFSLGSDTTVCRDKPFILDASAATGPFLWQDSSSGPTFHVIRTGQYWVQTYIDGCKVVDTINVIVDNCKLFIPNVITPNGDNLNDVFEIMVDLEEGWSLSIFNRWGQTVFFDDRYRNTWKGDGLSNGVYFYTLKNHTSGQIFNGTVTIMR